MATSNVKQGLVHFVTKLDKQSAQFVTQLAVLKGRLFELNVLQSSVQALFIYLSNFEDIEMYRKCIYVKT